MNEVKPVTKRVSTETFAWNYRIEGGDDKHSEAVNVYDEEMDFDRALKEYSLCPYKFKSLVRVVEVAI